MLLFGHPFIDFKPFYHIDEIDEIERTPANSALFTHFSETNLDIIKHMQSNHLTYALEVANLTEAIFAHNLGASYIIVRPELASHAQALAENYLFDAKILCRLENGDNLEETIIQGIDGVIYTQAIIKTSN